MGLLEFATRAHEQGRRLVAPLAGFPGLQPLDCSVKLAMQNEQLHVNAIAGLAERFAPDLVFPLMDLSVEANAIGREVFFPPEDSPTVICGGFQLDEIERLPRIRIAGDARARHVAGVLERLGQRLPPAVALGAYVTGPFTLAGLILGAEEVAVDTVVRPERLEPLLDYCEAIMLDYAAMLAQGRVGVLCVLDPSATLLSPDLFERFSAARLRTLIGNCNARGIDVIYHVCGNTSHLAGAMAASGAQALSLDSPAAGVDLPALARTLPSDVVLIGNIHPTGAILRGRPDDVRREVEDLLAAMAPHPNFILSTGCDLPRETPLQNLDAFMQAARACAGRAHA